MLGRGVQHSRSPGFSWGVLLHCCCCWVYRPWCSCGRFGAGRRSRVGARYWTGRASAASRYRARGTPPGEPFDRFNGARVITMLESDETKTKAMQLEVPPATARPSPRAGGRRRRDCRGRAVAMARSCPPDRLRVARDRACVRRTCRRACSISFRYRVTRAWARPSASSSSARTPPPPVCSPRATPARCSRRTSACCCTGGTSCSIFPRGPFDGIELGRMVALADQLVRHLPVV